MKKENVILYPLERTVSFPSVAEPSILRRTQRTAKRVVCVREVAYHTGRAREKLLRARVINHMGRKTRLDQLAVR